VNVGFFGGLWNLLIMKYVVFSETIKQTGMSLGPYYANFGISASVTLCDPEDVKTVLKNIDIFPKDRTFVESATFSRPLVGPDNLFAVNNPNWHGQRSLLNKAFISNGIFFKPMCKTINTCLSKWVNKEKVCVGSDIQKLTLDVLASSIFGVDFDSLNGNNSEPLESYNYALDAIMNPIRFLFPFTAKLPLKSNQEMFKHLDFFDKFCWQFMDETKKKMEQKKNEGDVPPNECQERSIIEMMFENNIPEQIIRDNLSLFFIVGHETTSNSLCWLLALLVSHPEVQQKARQEVLDKIPGEVTMDSLKELPYIDGFIKEGLRIYPPVPMIGGRIAVKDTVVGHVQIPAGSTVDLNLIAMTYNSKIWGDPQVVRPERWYPENITKEQRNAWLPFSSGPRICIGMNFSLMEQKLFLVYLLKQFQVKLAPNGIITPKKGATLNTYTPDTEKMILQFEKTK
jgi:cytochrome P450